MLVVLDLQPRLLSHESFATVVKGLVEAQAEQNRMLITKLGLPSLYKAKVRFGHEPWAGRAESVASAPMVLRRGWGDCAHLSAYRIGELQAEGVPASCKVYWREHRRPRTGELLSLYHVEVRLPDGSVEDPSRYLGML